ncbi:hypothetical protein BDV96DRAFT_650145 [Lophiotrema nucula]|uniref:Cylicin I n=1 Tax=Lophiotrema nucula TaxID=690887 RepID=A0A6A5YZS1_9PLEO|nr:hypothetical protein BDV96DRAFT_650145 [Lophiotrema nucula]
MVLPRYAALRASSIARCARPARFIRSAELQPWQRMVQRRTYASEHGHSESKSSDVPWIAGATVTTAVGLYLVTTQDLGGHEAHDEHGHGDAEHEEKDKPEDDAEQSEESDDKEEKDDKQETKDEGKEDKSDEKDEKDDKSDDSKEDKAPSTTDKPDPSKDSKSQNETSGKQQGLSNDDTGHSTSVADNPEKSSKGEGVAETAKLKGAVDPQRPAAENKDERGKATQDKSK